MEIDPDAAEFPCHQLAAHLRERITSGVYPAGRRLPSIAGLQAESGLSPKTVQRAIAVLAAEGLVRTVPSRGTYVVSH